MGDGTPLDEPIWIALLELCAVLEPRFPGLTVALHDAIVARLNLTEVVRLNGPRVRPAILAAYDVAERHVGVIAVLAPRAPKERKRDKRARRKRRG